VGVSRTSTSAFNSLGVNVHTTYGATGYDRDAYVDDVGDLGIKFARDMLCTGLSEPAKDIVCSRMREMKDSYGVTFTMIAGNPANLYAQTSNKTTALTELKAANRYAGLVSRVEAANEWDWNSPNNAVVQTTVNEMATWLRDWYPTFKADPVYSSIPFDGPSWVGWKGAEPLWMNVSDRNSITDTVNVHHYNPYARMPEDPNGGMQHKHAAEVPGTRSTGEFVVTETGYHCATNLNETAEHLTNIGVTERVQAYYVMRSWLEGIRLGAITNIWYEFMDFIPNPTKNDDQQHYGLIATEGDPNAAYTTWTYRKKPAFYTAKRFLSLIKDNTTGTPGTSLRYTIINPPTSLRSLLLSRNNGSFLLILWNAVSVQADPTPLGDNLPGPEQFPSDISVDVKFSKNRSVQTARPYTTDVYGSSSVGATHSITVGPDPTFILVS
jgi:hypothetical protein